MRDNTHMPAQPMAQATAPLLPPMPMAPHPVDPYVALSEALQLGDTAKTAATTHTLTYGLSAKGYNELADVLSRAFAQASAGKGRERHANELPFVDQPMQKIAERRGIGFILGQADKKSEEAQGMLERGEHSKATHELLGAIVYLAGAIIHIEKQERV